MKMKNIRLILAAALLITGSTACSSPRKNDQRNPVYKRKDSLPVSRSVKPALTPSAQAEPEKTEAQNSEVKTLTQEVVLNATAESPSSEENSKPVQSTDQNQGRIHRMVAESRQELINSGFSPEYFDAHFTVTDLVDEEYEKKVVWMYSIGEYKLEVIDPVNFSLDANGDLVYSHGVRQELGATHDIQNLLSLKDAHIAMRNCLGDFNQSWFRLIARELPGEASVWMYARSEKNIEGKDHTWMSAYLNLETGACEKEVVGSIHQPMQEK